MSSGSASSDRARFQRIETLFHSALELPSDSEREKFLRDSEPDEGVRVSVRQLLARHAAGDGTLRETMSNVAASTTYSAIGPYRIIRELGVGGMGTVLLAERLLGDTRQRVALKLIRGFPTSEARNRMARERSLLAELNHPNIARLVDAGETADRVPYIAMEFIEGVSLHAFCVTQGLDIRGRLTLFGQLCRAVQHAHQRLIVHRDIKPSNILVRDDGTPVLLDFGIGKLLDDTARDDTATRIYTPAYAAPEQVAGKSVTTATDIFGLGCVLYELLSDRSLAEVRVGDDVPPPSQTSLDPMRSRALRGELDRLVGKAMHPEPDRRYASAQAFADDVENFLHGRPLDAAPDSVGYRARKFVSRHRVGVGVAVAVLLLTSAFVFGLNQQRQRALQAESRAEHEARSASRSRDFLVSLFQQAAPDNTLGRAITVRELIDKGSERIRSQLVDEPETAARVGVTVAQVYSALGDPKAAISSAEKALALTPADASERALLRAEILEALSAAYDNTERFDDARRSAEEMLAIRQQYASGDHLNIARALTDLGDVAARHGDDAIARGYFDRAIKEFARARNVDPIETSNVFRGVTQIDIDEGKTADAIAHAQQSVDILDALPPMSPERLDAWGALARAQVASGDPAASIPVLAHALDVARESLGEDSTKVSTIENDLGVSLNEVGRYREAIAHLEKSIAIDEKLRPGERVATAFNIINLGAVYENMGDDEKAEALMREGIRIVETETPDEPQLNYFRMNLSRTLMFEGKLEESRALLAQSTKSFIAKEGQNSLGYAFSLFRLARLELAAGHLDEADRALDDTEHAVETMLPKQHPIRAQLFVIRGMVAAQRNDLPVAIKNMQIGETMQMELQESDPVSLALTRMRLGRLLLASGDNAGAKLRLDASLPIIEDALVPTASDLKSAHDFKAELDRRATRRE